MKRGMRFSILVSIVLSGVCLSGCSVDMFSSGGDDAVTKRKNYRPFHPGCSSFSIPETGLDAKSFRALVECFNANNSIPELQALTTQASDRTLSALTHILNGSFFKNEAQIAETYVFFSFLDKAGRLGKSVEDITKLFHNPDSISALLQFIDAAREGPLNPNSRELKMLSKWLQSVTPEGVELYLGVVEKFTRSPHFNDLYRAFEKNPLQPDEKKTIREAIRAWVTDRTNSGVATTNAGSAALFRKISIGAGRSFYQTLMEDPKTSARWMDKIFIASPNHHPWIDSFEGLRRGLASPMVCMGGSLKFKDPWAELLSELKTNRGEGFYNFSVRRGSTQTLILKECCEIPDVVLASYEDLLQGFGEADGVLFVRLLEAGVQGGLGEAFGKWMDRDSEILSPVFRILLSRGISESVLKIMSELSDTEWEKIGKTLEVFSAEGYPTQMKSWLARLKDADLERLGSLFLALPGLSTAGESGTLAEAISEVRNLFRSSNRHTWWEGVRVILQDSIEGKNEFATLSELSRLPEFKPAIQMAYEMGQDGRLSAMLFDLVRLFASTVREFPSEVMVSETWPDEKNKRFILKPSQSYSKPKYSQACSALKFGKSIESQKRNFYDCMGGSNQPGGELEAWVSLLERRTSSGGGTLASAVFSRIIVMLRTEFKSESKARWVAETFRQKRLPEFLGSIRDIQTFSKGEFADELRGVFKNLLNVPRTLDQFFERMSQYARTPAFVAVNRWIDDARSRVFPLPQSRFRASTDEVASRKMLTERECIETESALKSRLSELQTDIEESVVGWESLAGRSRQTWDEATLLERMRSLQPFLSDPVVATGIRRLLVELRSRHGAKGVLDWFEKRSLDVKPVMYIFPGDREARVRWMSSLDRLEVLLTAADFKFASWLFEENFVLKFIADIGNSWGDEPRENWPAEVQKKFPGGRKPPTLAETYDDILKFLTKFSGLGGLPKVGQCASAREYDPFVTAPGLIVPFWVKANLFNLKEVLSVYKENLPNEVGPMQDGMKFLRDLFYFVGYAGLEKNRDPSKPDTNPLSIIRGLGRLGFLRTSSLYFAERDIAVRARDESVLELAMKMAEVSQFSNIFTELFKGRWESSPVFALTRDVFRVSRENPEAMENFTSTLSPYLAIAGDFLEEKSHAENLISAILDSGALTNEGVLPGFILLNAELESESLGWKLWKTRAAVNSDRRDELLKFALSDSKVLREVLGSLAQIAESPRSRKAIVDASRSSELRRLKRSLEDLFPQATWIGGRDPVSEELGLVLRLWIIDSLRALGPDLMRFDVQDSKSFNEFLSALARFSESQSFEELEELYSRHLPR